jgi:hypothetical protein
MQFPEMSDYDTYAAGSSKGMDLFISLTPCSGSLKFYISDDYHKLFKKYSELVDDSDGQEGSKAPAYAELNVKETGPDSTVLVEHKTSRVGSGIQNSDNLRMDEYFDEFRVQGKRLKRIDRIDGTKLYIGIKTFTEKGAAPTPPGGNRLLEDDPLSQEAPGHHPLFAGGSDRAQGLKDFKESQSATAFDPSGKTTSQSKDNISTFEISATYVLGGQPDVLDLY